MISLLNLDYFMMDSNLQLQFMILLTKWINIINTFTVMVVTWLI